MNGLALALTPGWILGGGGGAAMPSGALGIWYADEAVTSPRVMIPNAVNSEVPNNLLGFSRRVFQLQADWNFSNSTVTDNAATAPDGTNDATTVVWGSADALVMAPVENVLAGTYTMAVDVATTDASTVDFRMGQYAAEVTKTATPTWTSFSVTFTRGSTGTEFLCFLRSLNASTPANLKICNARLFAGSSDLGAEAPSGALIFGPNAFNAQPTIAGGVIPRLSATNGTGLIQLGSGTSNLSAFTLFVVSKKKEAVNQPQPLFAYRSSVSAGGLTALYQGGSQQVATYLASSLLFDSSQIGLFLPRLDEWHILAYRYDGTTIDCWLDGARMYSETYAGISQQVKDLVFGGWGIGTYARFETNAAAIYPTALTTAQMAEAFAALKSRAALSGLTTGTGRWLLAEGDSITGNGGSANLYPGMFGANSSPVANGCVRATPGATLTTINNRAADVDATIPADKAGKNYILSLMIGTNHLGGGMSGATLASSVSTYCQARQTAGWDKVVLCTVLPKSADASFETERLAYNVIIKGSGWAAANGVDAICDIASQAIMGDVANTTDVTYYSDGVHPTTAGQVLLEPIYRATINAL